MCIRYYFAFVLILLTTCLLACGQVKNDPIIQVKDSPIVLEVVVTASGMVYPKEGDILEMRLHVSGVFEYDDYPAQNPPENMAGKVKITKKAAKLTTEEVNELLNIARQPDFLAGKSDYASLHPHVDDRWTITIRYSYEGKEKTIKAINFWDDRTTKDRAKYPPSMVNLLERTYALKNEAIKRDLKQ